MRLSMTAAAVVALTAATSQPSHAASAVDWVDVAVDRIAATGDGNCEVSGWVVTVRDGDNFEPGSAIDFDMDCGRTGADPDAFAGGLSGADLAAAGASVKVSVKLDGSGRVIDYVGMDTSRTDGVSRGAYITDSYSRPYQAGDPAPAMPPSLGDDDQDDLTAPDAMHDEDSMVMDDPDAPMDDQDAPEDDPQDEPQLF